MRHLALDRSTVPPHRLARLARSVNASRWFRYPASRTPEHFLNFITEADLDLLVSLGVTGVRLTVGVEQLSGPTSRERPAARIVEYVKVAIGRLVSRGFAVVVSVYFQGGTRVLE